MAHFLTSLKCKTCAAGTCSYTLASRNILLATADSIFLMNTQIATPNKTSMTITDTDAVLPSLNMELMPS